MCDEGQDESAREREREYKIEVVLWAWERLRVCITEALTKSLDAGQEKFLFYRKVM